MKYGIGACASTKSTSLSEKENMLIVKMVKMLKTKAFLRFIKVFISW
jgi:hypothetical protein